MEYMPQMYSGYIDAKRKMNMVELARMAIRKYKEKTGEDATVVEMNCEEDITGNEFADEVKTIMFKSYIPRNHVRIYREM